MILETLPFIPQAGKALNSHIFVHVPDGSHSFLRAPCIRAEQQ